MGGVGLENQHVANYKLEIEVKDVGRLFFPPSSRCGSSKCIYYNLKVTQKEGQNSKSHREFRIELF